jgi:seryl-tRNA synthetase
MAAAISHLIAALIKDGATFDEAGKPVGLDLPSTEALEPGPSSIIP